MKTDGPPLHYTIIIKEELETIPDDIDDEVLIFDAFTPTEIDDIPYIDFNEDEYPEIQPTDREILNSTPTSQLQQHRPNLIVLLNRLILKEDLKAFYKYLEETRDKDPYGLEELFGESK